MDDAYEIRRHFLMLNCAVLGKVNIDWHVGRHGASME
jgi:hypothetical protein